jgi:hypothetical protein
MKARVASRSFPTRYKSKNTNKNIKNIKRITKQNKNFFIRLLYGEKHSYTYSIFTKKSD